MAAYNKHAQSMERRRLWWRIACGLMLTLHAPLTIKAVAGLFHISSTQASGASLLLLALSNGFFVLEIYFAFCVRVVADRRSAVIFLIIVAFLHAGVLERSLPETATRPDISRLIIFALEVVALSDLLRRAILIYYIRAAKMQSAYQHARRRYSRWTQEHLFLRPQDLGLSIDLPRPPPSAPSI